MFYKVGSESDVSTWAFVHRNLLEERGEIIYIRIYCSMQKRRKEKRQRKG